MTLSACLLASVAAWSSTTEPADPASHLWIVNELFSSADGTVQFVELWECCGSSGETFMAGKKVYSDATGHTFTFPSNLVGDTAFRYLLIGTPAFAATPGAPTPDHIVPAGFFSMSGDTIRWHIYPNATLQFTNGQLPLDGTYSLNYDGTTGVNSPTNWAGQYGSIAIASVPGMPFGWVVALVGGALLVGVVVLRLRAA